MWPSKSGASVADAGRPPESPAEKRTTASTAISRIDGEATTTYDARRGRTAMLDAVGMNEINKIFAVIDAMGIHREQVTIPLGTGKGRVRRMPNGKLEIIVDAETPIDEWLRGLPDLIRAAQSA